MIANGLLRVVDTAVCADGDTEGVVRKKRVLFLSYVLVVAVVGALMVTADWTTATMQNMSWLLNFCTSGSAAMWMWSTKSASNTLVLVVISLLSVGLFFQDWYEASTGSGYREWSTFIIIIDVMLLCDLPGSFEKWIVAAIVSWMLLTGLETAYRFGLYDVPGTSPYVDRVPTICDDPPCKRNVLEEVSFVFGKAMVLVLDFYFTRGFAHSMRVEQYKLRTSIETANLIAADLAKFDLKSASLRLDRSEDCRSLPTEMQAAFENLLENLNEYRPYLPSSCLPGGDEEGDGGDDGQDLLNNPSYPDAALTSTNSVVSTGSNNGVGHAEMEKKRGAILITNVKHTHVIHCADVEKFREDFHELTETVLAAMVLYKGSLHFILGDRHFCTFNASKRCLGYSRSCAEAAMDITTNSCLALSAGGCAGSMMVGDLGCATTKQFCVLSTTVCVAHALERLASHSSAPTTFFSKPLYTDTRYHFDFKLLLQSIEHRGHVIYAFELLGRSHNPNPPTEWMYEVNQERWSSYNSAGMQLLRGAGLSETLERYAKTLSGIDKELLLAAMPIVKVELC